MATTLLSLANGALRILGGQPITQEQYDNPNHSPGNIMSATAPDSLESVLADFDWPICRKTVASTGTDSGLAGYDFPFGHDLSALSPALTHMRELTDEVGYNISNFRIEGTTLYCEDETIYIRYSFDITDPANLPKYLVDTIEAHIALEAAISVTASEDRKRIAEEAYLRSMAHAKRRAKNEDPAQGFMDESSSTFLASRNPSGSGYDIQTGNLPSSPFNPS